MNVCVPTSVPIRLFAFFAFSCTVTLTSLKLCFEWTLKMCKCSNFWQQNELLIKETFNWRAKEMFFWVVFEQAVNIYVSLHAVPLRISRQKKKKKNSLKRSNKVSQNNQSPQDVVVGRQSNSVALLQKISSSYILGIFFLIQERAVSSNDVTKHITEHKIEDH